MNWTTCATFIFRGNLLTPVSEFKVCAWTRKSNNPGEVRIYDYTNNKELASLDVTSTNKTIYTTSIIDTSDDESIIEIQGRSNNDRVYISYTGLY